MHNEAPKPTLTISDRTDSFLNIIAHILLFSLILSPQIASANSGLAGISMWLRDAANLLIFEWGYYIGIITLGIQGFRWKTGRISLSEFGVWLAGICIVFFAPQIVSSIRNSAGASVL